MAGVATLRLLPDALHAGTPSFNFLAVALPQAGMVLDRAMDLEEDLISSGINGQRWLRVFAQFTTTQATTVIDTADYGAAITLARAHMQASGRFADLTIAYGSLTIIHRRLKILAPVAAQARIGAVVGSGVTGSPLASVRTDWNWKCTEAS